MFFGSFWGKLLTVFLVSMVPIVELRGAIPIGYGLGIDNIWILTVLSVFGNLIPVPFIILFIKRIFAWLRKTFPKLDGFITKLEDRANSKSERVQKSAFWGLFVFVAIPLPGTGAWTGALIAAMLDMRLKKAFPAIAMGVATAGVVIAVLVSVFGPHVLKFFGMA